ncbi:MAG: alginate export family protein [Acidobacteria bacterium]|nr:alginate export family protein [Acidobacteriota bacterium]
MNRQLPKWLRFGGEYRARFEGSSAIGFKPDNGDYYLLNRFRINMKLLPSSWMKFVFQGQDSRVFWNSRVPDAPPYADTMDLRLAYMELGDTDTRPISLRVGRQELFFGEQRLIGHLNWTNTARSFDAVRATFRHQGYRLDAFAASVVNLRNGEFDSRIAGNNLHGLYGGIEKLVPNAIIEPYLLWRLEPGVRTESGALAHRDFKTVGFRWVGKLPANFDYGVEIAGQTGSVGTDSIRAWGGHWLLAYTIAGARYKPRLIAEYNHASGDKDPRDGKRGTFDQLYPTGHEKYGLADQVGWRNIHDVRSGVELKPHAKWLLTGSYHSWWRASSRDGLYNAAGVLLPGSTSKPGRYVGQELDFQAIYTASKQFQIGGGFAQIFPGALLKNATAGRPYNFPYLMLTTSF